jgi:hypothetical protein
MRAVLLYSKDTGHVLGGYTDHSSSSSDAPAVASLVGEGGSLEVAIVDQSQLISVPFGSDKLHVAVTTDPAHLEIPFGRLGIVGDDEPQVVELLPSDGLSVNRGTGLLKLPSDASRDTKAELYGATDKSGPIVIIQGKKENTFPTVPVDARLLLLVAGYEPIWIS